jgi:thymidine kinase
MEPLSFAEPSLSLSSVDIVPDHAHALDEHTAHESTTGPLLASPASAVAPGGIQVIFGPMFSGKTTELLRRVRRYTFARKSCAVIKYAKDKRYADEDLMATHDRQTWSALSAQTLADVVGPRAAAIAHEHAAAEDGFYFDPQMNHAEDEDIRQGMDPLVWSADVVGIDEGQFFDDLVPVCELLANLGKIVIVAALDGTFQRRPFESTLGLLSVAESICKLSAVCMGCFRPAAFSKRLGNETAIEVIGGADKYVAVCRECYHRPDATLRKDPFEVSAAKKPRRGDQTLLSVPPGGSP